jgi:general secretion pathway protein G
LSSRRQGFTLLELIVVITIIGLLGTIVVVNVQGVGPKARKTKVTADIKNIHQVAEMLFTSEGRYPETIEDMVNARDDDGMPKIASLKDFPKDPWQNEYVYEIIDGTPQVRCLGKDAAEGDGDGGEDVDIIYPVPSEQY